MPASLTRSRPLSLAQAIEFSDDGRFICTAEFPYGVMYANKSWTKLTGYQQHEIEGKDLCFMHGALTDTVSAKQMMYTVQLTGYGQASLINYTKGGKPFWCDILIQPIISKDMYGDEQITHLLGTLVKTASVDASDSSSRSASESEIGEQEGNDWMTPASTNDSENSSVSSWNSTSDNGSGSPYRDNSEDNLEDAKQKRVETTDEEPNSSKRPRLEVGNLMALSQAISPEKRIHR